MSSGTGAISKLQSLCGGRQRKKAKAVATGRRSAASGVEDAIAEVAAAEGAAADAEAEGRPEPPAKPAPRQKEAAPQSAPPSEPTQRQKAVEA